MVQAFPSITDAEFSEACAHIEKLCSGLLEGSNWLSIKWTGRELLIQQSRKRSIEYDTACTEEADDAELEETDQEYVNRQPAQTSADFVINFSIVLSPTYRAPVLWFRLSSQTAISHESLDHVYEAVVAPHAQQSLRQIGVLGGITIANHPISDMPAFFIHPCRTQETLEQLRPDKSLSPFEYLMLWFGVIPPAVGLSIPLEVAKEAANSSS